MEKTTKKKKSKRLKKRIGLIAVGGLSFVLTICLSVGATLAWFAGSTWSSKSLYMGGPVYVEMAGRGKSGTTGTPGTDDAKWIGGSGSLDIQASTRDTGTVTGTGALPTTDLDKVLLPGQKYEIYSQARVFSTAYKTDVADGHFNSSNSGANVSNTTSGNGTVLHRDTGTVTTATTSVLRARFSVSIEFDPYVGFNNFRDPSYADNYPVQSNLYYGDYTTNPGSGDAEIVYAKDTPKDHEGADLDPDDTNKDGLAWDEALGKEMYNVGNYSGTLTKNTRRDGVKNTDNVFTDAKTAGADMTAIKNGTKKSIYAWKFISAYDYSLFGEDDVHTINSVNYAKMPAPFDGSETNAGGTGFYGVWILDDSSIAAAGYDYTEHMTESNAFYNARCNSYLQSYVEDYITEYGGQSTRTIGKTLAQFEQDINSSFINLVNDSSDAIHAGNVTGMTVTNGVMTYNTPVDTDSTTEGVQGVKASWLYVDSKIGNDTNTQELSTSVGGWWYLVATDGASVYQGEKIETVTDEMYSAYTDEDDNTPTTDIKSALQSRQVVKKWTEAEVGTGSSLIGSTGFVRKAYSNESVIKYGEEGSNAWNNKQTSNQTSGQFYATDGFGAADSKILYAKLYEVTPDFANITGSKVSRNGTTKVVSYSFPFVNGSSVLPTTLTNIFANAKITFQISFQAVQAFFPYTTTIDGLNYTSNIIGTPKALNIQNAIPVFNEAFAY